MGMDVYGINPTAEVGEYFRNNVWWWHPLWDYACEVAPGLADEVPHGHSDDGDGLSAHGAAKLAAILTAELDAGRTAQYEADYMARINALPDEDCWLAHGTGNRSDDIGVKHGMVEEKRCNGCASTGKVRPWVANYPSAGTAAPKR